MSVARSAALKIDWAKITTTLGLKGQTLASLQSFKKRNEEARRKFAVLSESPQTINFDYYRQHLKNSQVVDEIEAAFKQFRPTTYDVSKQVRAIEAFEKKALESAVETKDKVDAELKDLEATLKNIEEARSFDELTVDDVAAARPDIDKRTEQMVIKGRWMPPGYQEKFGNLSLL